jgi:hypothetical protein
MPSGPVAVGLSSFRSWQTEVVVNICGVDCGCGLMYWLRFDFGMPSQTEWNFSLSLSASLLSIVFGRRFCWLLIDRQQVVLDALSLLL